MYRVYVAEDEPPILKNIVAVIDQMDDVEVVVAGTARNGRDALEDFGENSYDILLTDIKMPFITGLELIERIKEISPKTICVVISGYSDFEYAKTAIQLQAKDYLLKPVHPDKLKALLTKLIIELNAKHNKDCTNALNHLLYGEALGEFRSALNIYKEYRVILVNVGSFLEDVYNLSHEGIRYWNEFDPMRITSLFGRKMDAYLLASKYPPERIILLASKVEINDDDLLPKIYKLHKEIKADDVVVNMIYGQRVDNPRNIVSEVLDLNKMLYDKMFFGESNIYDRQSNEDEAFVYEVDNHLLGLKITDKALGKLVSKECDKIIRTYAHESTKQKVIQTTLDKVMEEYFQELGIRANDVVGTVTDYHNLNLHLQELIHSIEVAQDDSMNTSSTNVVNKITDYIDQNYMKAIDYKMFSQLFSYNEVYISSEFKRQKGLAPGKYLTKVRIDHAKHLMEENKSLLLKEIAEMVGYNDALYFSRVFKSVVGTSPSSYMRNH